MIKLNPKHWKEVDCGIYVTDGIALNIIEHPKGKPVEENKKLNPDSLETIEVDFPDDKGEEC